MPKDKPRARDYAVFVPKARTLRARILQEERIREVIAQPGLEEALNLLRDTMYSEALQYKRPDLIQAALIRNYATVIDRLAKATPRQAVPLIEAFRRDLEARDLAAIASSVARGTPVDPHDYPMAGVEGSLIHRLVRDQEALGSMQRLVEALRGSWAEEYSQLMLRLSQEGLGLEWLGLAISAREYSKALSLLDPRMGRKTASRILCPLIKWRITASLIQAKREGIPARHLDHVYADVPDCKVKWRKVRLVYEREPGIEGLVASLREVIPGIQLESSKDIQEALAQARAEARKKAKEEALKAFQGYPFHSGLVAATLTLLLIDLEDLSTILTGLSLGLSPEEYIPSTTYQIPL